MKKSRRCFLIVAILSLYMSFNVLAMNDNDVKLNFPNPKSPSTEAKSEDRTKDYSWIWINDNTCLRTRTREQYNKASILQMWDMGFISRWSEGDETKTRDTYSGKWLEDANGTKSFTFDDYTIPVGPTNIDGVIYAFNGYGELMDGYNYWGDLTTGPDGLVTSDNPEFTEWLATQYVPECTSHE